MLEKFSFGAIQALNAAREEALRLEFSQVDSDHLFLGLAHERQGLTARTLQKLGVEHRKLRLAVEHLSGRGYSLTRQEDLVFSAATLRALARAARARPTLVESQDILRALLDEQEPAVVGVIRELGLEVDQVRAMAEALDAKDSAPTTEPTPETAVVPKHFNQRLLTPAGQSVLGYAHAASRFYGHTIVGTEQLLSGLLYVRMSLAAQVLAANAVDVLEVEAVCARLIGQGSGTAEGRVSLSRWVEQVLEQAWEHAKRLKHDHVGTGHILMGLIDLDVGGALYIMDHLDLNLAQIRYDVEQAFAAAPGDPEPEELAPADPALAE
ncbi:MAG: repeat containing protein [Cyanobacteria bacterium RYN_339]|nr:repeat containing protein [Cyanobacteria bacterium RYN_339]